MKAARTPTRSGRGVKPGSRGRKAGAISADTGDEPSQACTFPVVGVGASAGGLDAFLQLLEHLPGDAGLALLFIQHLDPQRKSMLAGLLGKSAQMPVVEIEDGMPVRPNRIHVIAPGSDVVYSSGVLRLIPADPQQRPRTSVDVCFRSLARELGSRAVGVVLSGNVPDGVLGLQAIKAAGGITFAQDEKSARCCEMPRSAINAGCVDSVLPPDAIAGELVRISQHSGAYSARSSSELAVGMPEELLDEILVLLRDSFRVDFASYRRATFQRRIFRRMLLNHQEELGQYLDFLRKSPAELNALYEDLLIRFTGFFRDADVFETLTSRVLPKIVESGAKGAPLRIWVPGCSTGEEAYSIAICLVEYLQERKLDIPVRIFGTDLSDSALEKARAGWYPENIAMEVSSERLRRFFAPTDGGYRVAGAIRETCVFARQNLISNPPFSRLDLISCRNVLVYFGAHLQDGILKFLHFALKPGGYLLLGTAETVGPHSELFSVVDKKSKVFLKKQLSPRPDLSVAGHARAIPPAAPGDERRRALVDLYREADQAILAHLAPIGVLVDEDFNVLHFRGQTGLYLEPAPGEPSHNVLRMARRGLLVYLRAALNHARKENIITRREGVRVKSNGETRVVNLEVLPIRRGPGSKRSFMVLFEDVTESGADGGRPPRSQSRALREAAVARLEQELVSARQYLQSVIEEQEATTEQLKSANEEIHSSNEELQRANEELEAAREELQSVNEELTTVNDELKSRNDELSRSNNDLSNLLDSVNIPMVLLSNDLRVRRFNPPAQRMLNLNPADLGRPWQDISLRIDVPGLEQLVEYVIRTLATTELSVRDQDGCWYSMWIRPYQTADNRIEGAVVAMTSINDLKQSREQIREVRTFVESLLETVREAVLVLDQDFCVRSVNRSFCRMFQVNRSDVEDRVIFDLGHGEWNIPDLRRVLEAALAGDERLQETEFEREFGDLGGKVVGVLVRRLPGRAEGSGLLVALENITERKAAGEAVGSSEDRLGESDKMEAISRIAGGIAHDFNNHLMTILGYCELLLASLEPDHRGRPDLERIRKAGQQAGTLTRQLLAFRPGEPQTTLVDLNVLIGNIWETLCGTAGRGIELEFLPGQNAGMVRADPSQLEQVIVNLALNARDLAPRGGRLTFETARVDLAVPVPTHPGVAPGIYVLLAVSCSRTGTEAESPDRLLELARRKGRGTGLGLALLYGTIARNGGTMFVNSKSGREVILRIYFPEAV